MSTVVKERKVSPSASCKIENIIKQLFLPMLKMPTPGFTSFQAEDHEDLVIKAISNDKPEAMRTEESFVDYMVTLYRKFNQENLRLLGASSNNVRYPE